MSWLRHIAHLYFLHPPYTQPICVTVARCAAARPRTPTRILDSWPVLGFARTKRGHFFSNPHQEKPPVLHTICGRTCRRLAFYYDEVPASPFPLILAKCTPEKSHE